MATDEVFANGDEEFVDEADSGEGDDEVELEELDDLDEFDADYDGDDDDADSDLDEEEEEEEEGGDDLEGEEEEEGEDDVEDEVAEGDEDDADEAEESLDVILAREKVIDDEELARLGDEPRQGLSVTTVPAGAGEFTCRSCFLVKRRAQLADEEEMICFDCA